MDRKVELDHLAIAEKAVADGERHVERDEQMIADLFRPGHCDSTSEPELTLRARPCNRHP
jgi:hypothetical protein